MKLYKRIFLYFLRLRPRKARISRYLRFHILVTRCSIGIRRNRNPFPLHIKIDFESQFFFSISFFFSECYFCSYTHAIESEWEKRGYFFFIFPLKDRLSWK
uniref:ORF100 n=1 Tax=Oryza meyeriana var. granulata TaxID=110450 RepID=Q2F6K0_9ORYZ|nr:ORF100 [Oryza meyeriana var. granulata]